MNWFRTEPARRAVNGLMDVAFILYLLSEWLYRYTLTSRLCLVFFGVSVLIGMVQREKLYLSNWFLFSALFILWGAIGLQWTENHDKTMDMIKTLLINLAFVVCLYQYFMLRRDAVHCLRLTALAGFLFFLAVAAFSVPVAIKNAAPNVLIDRFGWAIGVNPNDAALLAGFTLGILLLLATGSAKRSWRFALLLPIPLAVLVLTGSLKGFLFTGCLTVLFLLLRFPKRWYIKAGLFFLFCGFAFWILIKPDCMSHFPIIYYRVTLRLRELVATVFSSAPADSSSGERMSYIELGRLLIPRAPWRGYGLDSFCTFPSAEGSYSHNNYIELLVSGGIPLLALYYLPWLALLFSSARLLRKMARASGAQEKADTRNAAKLLFTFTLLLLPLDYAMVSYYERTTFLMPILLLALVRMERSGERSELDPFVPYLRNPFYLFAYLSSRGYLRFLPDESYIKLVYRGCLGAWPNLKAPEKFTEKVQYLKLHDHNPLYQTLCDKLAVREYVSKRIGETHLVPLLGVWEDPSQIRFWELPPRFVLKCTHDSGSVRVCTNKAEFDQWGAVRFLKKRLNRNYYYTGREWAYKDVPPRVMAEAFIGGADGSLPDDYKIFCFDGKPRAICFCTNRRKGTADYYFMTPEWQLLPVNDKTREASLAGTDVPRPALLAEMLRMAETLSEGLPQLRVDLYQSQGKIWFGELTLYDQSGFADDYVGDGDVRMGQWITAI